MNHRLLSFLRGLLLVQYAVQCYNIYGLHIRSIYWPRVLYPLYILMTSPIFDSFDEKKSHLMKPKPSSATISLLDIFICVFISLLPVEVPPFAFHFSWWSILIQIASAVLYSSPLWIAHPYEILLTSQYFKIPLFESALLLILYWSFYLTYFITIYPPLSLAPQFHPILYEPLPLLIHILFVYILTILLLAVMIYTHHRMQFVVDTRRAGVWVVHSSNEPPASNPPPSSNPSTPRSSSSNPSHKVPQWKPTHSYRLNDICTFEQQQYRLISPFSSYSLPPIVTSSLSYKYFIYTIMNKESGPLSQSYVLTCLLQFLSVVGCSIIVVGLLYPRQQQIGFFLHGFALSLLLYYYQKSFLSPRLVNPQGVTFQSSDDGNYVYHPYQSSEPSHDTTFPPPLSKGKGGHRGRSRSASGGNELHGES